MNSIAGIKFFAAVVISLLFIQPGRLTPQPISAQNILLEDHSEQPNIFSSRGINAGINFTSDIFSNISGGMANKSAYIGNVNFLLNIELEKLTGIYGTYLSANLLGVHGKIPSEYTGTIQGTSSIAAENQITLYELWIEQTLFSDKLSILFGLYDLNSEFDVRKSSMLFINPSHGIGAELALTGTDGPSIFPKTFLAGRIKYFISNEIEIKSAFFINPLEEQNLTGNNNTHIHTNADLLFAAEFTYSPIIQDSPHNFFTISLGGWYYTSKFEKHSSNHLKNYLMYKDGNFGGYVSAEKKIFSESILSSNGLSAFIRLGFADSEINTIDSYFGAGINYTGLFAGRENDILGVAIAHSNIGSDFISAQNLVDLTIPGFESIIELTYKFFLPYSLNIQPDFQYAVNPANCCKYKHSFSCGVRLQAVL